MESSSTSLWHFLVCQTGLSVILRQTQQTLFKEHFSDFLSITLLNSVKPFLLFLVCYRMSSEILLDVAYRMTGRRSEKDFRSLFGGPSEAIEFLWNCILAKMEPLPHTWNIDDLLMCLHFLKNPQSNLVCSSSRCGISTNTFKKHLSTTLSLIDFSLPEVIF